MEYDNNNNNNNNNDNNDDNTCDYLVNLSNSWSWSFSGVRDAGSFRGWLSHKAAEIVLINLSSNASFAA